MENRLFLRQASTGSHKHVEIMLQRKLESLSKVYDDSETKGKFKVIDCVYV
jgi:hypothetical protein